MKYITYRHAGSEIGIMFPNHITHMDVYHRVLRPRQILGAGFCRLATGGGWNCYGASQSLGVASRPRLDGLVLDLLTGVGE